MDSKLRLATLGLLATVAVACQAPVFPLSAQQGSSVMIPIATHFEVETGQIGFGGSLKADVQRGSLVYRLDDASGMVLPTYTTTLIPASPMSPLGRFGNQNTAAWMVVSLVDIPTTAPLGTHGLYVTHEVAGAVEQIPYSGQLKILPRNITVTLPAGGTETITGATTRIGGALGVGGVFTNFGSTGGDLVPDPQIVVASGGAHALELEVSYPTAILDVKDVVERRSMGRGLSHPAMVWFAADEAAGVVRISAVSASGESLDPLAVVFKLAGSTRLDESAVGVTVQLAADWDGNEFSYTPAKWIE
jgi:hypothetical protein